MKRSEMENMIAQSLRDLNKGDCGNFAIWASILLDEIIEAGMLPPAEYHPRDKYANNIVKEAMFYMKWEE